MKILKITLGAILALASLWLGSYALGVLPNGHWALFPSYITACLGFLGGWLLVLSGVV